MVDPAADRGPFRHCVDLNRLVRTIGKQFHTFAAPGTQRARTRAHWPCRSVVRSLSPADKTSFIMTSRTSSYLICSPALPPAR
jgi:hypothetical protein